MNAKRLVSSTEFLRDFPTVTVPLGPAYLGHYISLSLGGESSPDILLFGGPRKSANRSILPMICRAFGEPLSGPSLLFYHEVHLKSNKSAIAFSLLSFVSLFKRPKIPYSKLFAEVFKIKSGSIPNGADPMGEWVFLFSEVRCPTINDVIR